METLSTMAMINFIENMEGKTDQFLLNYRKKQQKKKNKRLLLLQKNVEQKRKRVTKINDYFKMIKTYEPDVFHSHFRMLRSTFEILQKSLKPFWTRSIRGRLGISLEKCLYVTLWKLCNSDITFRKLSDRFNITSGTAHKIFYKTIELICLLKTEIMWPSVSQQKIIMNQFKDTGQNPFPFVIGCVDVTDFNISMPRQDAASYYNRKGNYTILMQAICDSKLRFLDVFIGCPGSYHKAYVWKISPIFKAITSSQVQVAENALVLGDAAYSLSKLLMTPYRDNGNLTCEECQFNYYLNSTRDFIEQTFDFLKNKFKILKNINLGSVEKTSKIIYACTILHNFIMKRENIEVDNTGNIDNGNSYNTDVTDYMEGNESDMDGLIKRRNLTTLFCS